MLRDSRLEMVVCSEDTERSGDRMVNRIKDAQAGEIKAAKGHVGSHVIKYSLVSITTLHPSKRF